MRLTRIYYCGALQEGNVVELSAVASHHLRVVLRFKCRDKLIVFNGDGCEYLAEVSVLEKKMLRVRIIERQTVARESPLVLELAQGLARGERMDYAIQKAVELGVHAITPLITEYSNVKLSAERTQQRMLHWQQIIIHACEQSGRLVLPVLHVPQQILSWLAKPKTGVKLVCTPQDTSSAMPDEVVKQVTLLIGPEGGLSADEIQQAIAVGYRNIQLGRRILRTETATVAALTMAQLHWGDFYSS